jgi:hypothetical protein
MVAVLNANQSLFNGIADFIEHQERNSQLVDENAAAISRDASKERPEIGRMLFNRRHDIKKCAVDCANDERDIFVAHRRGQCHQPVACRQNAAIE